MDNAKAEQFRLLLLQIVVFIVAGFLAAWAVTKIWSAQQKYQQALRSEADARRADLALLAAKTKQQLETLEDANVKLRDEIKDATVEQQQLRHLNMALAIQLEEHRNKPDEPGTKPLVRSVTTEQIPALASQLEQFAGTSIEIWQLEDPEAARLAQEIAALLTAARWSVTITRFGALNPPRYGVICVHPGNPAGKAFVKAMQSINVDASEKYDLDGFVIIVGLKPPG